MWIVPTYCELLNVTQIMPTRCCFYNSLDKLDECYAFVNSCIIKTLCLHRHSNVHWFRLNAHWLRPHLFVANVYSLELVWIQIYSNPHFQSSFKWIVQLWGYEYDHTYNCALCGQPNLVLIVIICMKPLCMFIFSHLHGVCSDQCELIGTDHMWTCSTCYMKTHITGTDLHVNLL